MTDEVDPETRAAVLDAVPPGVDERTEVRLTGQPNGGYRPYDFTFRTDTENWKAMAGVLRAAGRWENVRVQRRHVRVETRVTSWEDLDPEAAAGGA